MVCQVAALPQPDLRDGWAHGAISCDSSPALSLVDNADRPGSVTIAALIFSDLPAPQPQEQAWLSTPKNVSALPIATRPASASTPATSSLSTRWWKTGSPKASA